MTAKITFVTGETIRVDAPVDAVVSDINDALASASLLGVRADRGRVVWVNPMQVVRVDGGHAAESGWRPAAG
jgi:hypothetical protein